MGTPYSSQAVSGYNSSPPADDGSTVSSNKISWATIKAKLPDPILTLVQAINTALVAALNVADSTTSVSYTTLSSDHLKPIEVTGTTTISLMDAASAPTTGYIVTVVNKGSAIVTVALVTAANTLDGTSNGSVTLTPGNAATFALNQAANGYLTINRNNPYIHGADIVSASTLNLDTATGDCVDVTGTTTITAVTLQDGGCKTVRFTGVLTLTNGASLVLPGGANITTAAGDYAIFRGYGSSIVRCVVYNKASGAAVAAPTAATQSDQQTGTSTTVMVTPGRQQYHASAIKAWGYVTNNGTATLQQGYNCSIARTAQGRVTVTITNAMANATYAVVACVEGVSNSDRAATIESGKTTTTFVVATHTATPSLVDQDFSFMVVGTLA